MYFLSLGVKGLLPCTTVKATELEERVLDAESSGNKQRVDALLLGAIKSLRANRAKPDLMMMVSLTYLAKSKPELFTSRRVVEVRFKCWFKSIFMWHLGRNPWPNGPPNSSQVYNWAGVRYRLATTWLELGNNNVEIQCHFPTDLKSLCLGLCSTCKGSLSAGVLYWLLNNNCFTV